MDEIRGSIVVSLNIPLQWHKHLKVTVGDFIEDNV